MASPRFRDTGRFVRHTAPTKTYTPANLADLMRCLDPASKVPTPIRIRGAGTASTDCNTNPSGSIVNTTGLNHIINIDAYNHTVKVEAGVRLGALVNALAEQGLELIGNHDQMERTVGGAIASPCNGACIGERASYLSTQVIDLKVVTSTGQLMKVSDKQKHLLNAFRLSYGLLGVITKQRFASARSRLFRRATAAFRSTLLQTLRVGSRVGMSVLSSMSCRMWTRCISICAATNRHQATRMAHPGRSRTGAKAPCCPRCSSRSIVSFPFHL